MFEDSDPKRVCRFLQYRRFKRMWEAGGYPVGWSIVLAGDEAAEAGLLRHYIRCNPANTIFVDMEPAGLSQAKKVWPEVLIYHGRIEKLLSNSTDKVGFLNLDFCGYLNQTAEDCVQLAKNLIADKGIVSYTFVRGRECGATAGWKKVQDEGLRALKNDPVYSDMNPKSALYLDTVRFLGYSGILKQTLGTGFELIFLTRYASDKSPMGVLAFQKMPKNSRTQEWKKELVTYSSPEEQDGCISYFTNKDRMKELVLELTESLPPALVAEIFNIPRTSLAALLAHKTRGTYKKQTL